MDIQREQEFPGQLLRGWKSVSVGFEIGPENVEAIAILTATPIDYLSQHIDKHIERGME